MLSAWLFLFLVSNPMFASWLAASLESQYPPVEIDSIDRHDAIIVLGGGLVIPQKPVLRAQLSSGSDRYWHATRLYRSGKAPIILIAGGNVFQQTDEQGNVLPGEAYYAKQLLIEWGVPASAIYTEADSRTTSENRLKIRKLLSQLRVDNALLVTSALHMPRARYEFEDLPLSITPASADVLVRKKDSPTLLRLMPSANALSLSTRSVHEYYGLLVARLSKI